MRLKPGEDEPSSDYLSDLSPRDKPWDVHKWQSGQVARLYEGTDFDPYAGRISQCGELLSFCWGTDPVLGGNRLKLKACRFCRVRHCPVCQWRRSLMWIARFLKALPNIKRDYPTARYLFLTLTVRNCELPELRQTLTHMNEAWKRLSNRKPFPAIGFSRATEITKGKDGTAHPHFHCLLMVKQSYFQGKYYLSQADWTELWKHALQVEYTPIVDVRAVKPNQKHGMEALTASVVEAFKYSVKPDDLIGFGTDEDKEWLLELTKQLHKTRAIALGGILRDYLSESEPEDLLTESGDEELIEEVARLLFGWRERVNRYVKVDE